METTKISQNTSAGGDRGTTDLMAEMAKEADQIIINAGKAARQEAEQEIERILKQYEEKTKQIVLKIREETNTRATQIADNVREAILLKIEKASADAIAGAIADSSRKVEELVKNQTNLVGEEGEPAPAEAKVDQKSSPTQPQASSLAEPAEGDEVKDEKGNVKLETKHGSEIRFEQDFDQWLSQ